MPDRLAHPRQRKDRPAPRAPAAPPPSRPRRSAAAPRRPWPRGMRARSTTSASTSASKTPSASATIPPASARPARAARQTAWSAPAPPAGSPLASINSPLPWVRRPPGPLLSATLGLSAGLVSAALPAAQRHYHRPVGEVAGSAPASNFEAPSAPRRPHCPAGAGCARSAPVQLRHRRRTAAPRSHRPPPA